MALNSSKTGVRSPVDVAARYNLPLDIKFCVRCVISNQRPRISFNAEGVCSACQYAEHKKTINFVARERELKSLLDKHRSTDGSFDVVVPSSGGKDSTIVAHKLKYEYGMHPLCVTFAPNRYTDIGWQNLQNFVHQGGMNDLLMQPDGQVYRKMARLAFQEMGDPFLPFIYGVKSWPLVIATKWNIPLVFYGENGEVEYGGDTKNFDQPSHNVSDDLVKHYFSGFDQTYWKQHGITDADLHPFQTPPLEEMRRVGIESHFWSYYHNWIPQENYYYASEHTGFEANPDGRSEGTYSKYASLDDRIDGFHYYLGFIKFGIGRATSDAAHEVRDGHITRAEAVALVRKYDGEFPQKYFKDFLEYTNLSEKEFYEVVDQFRSPHLWKKENGEWKLKIQVS